MDDDYVVQLDTPERRHFEAALAPDDEERVRQFDQKAVAFAGSTIVLDRHESR